MTLGSNGGWERMIEISKLSSIYDVRSLTEENTDEILEVLKDNPQFYEYSDAEPTKQQILSDMYLLPTGTDMKDKYYVGFYRGRELMAIMDIIDGYPKEEVAYIGFFMMGGKFQGRQIGSTVIREVCAYLKQIGKTTIRLVIDKANPQSTHFWNKNGFVVFREVERNGHILMEADKAL